ncbi:hypothetical protein D2E62_21560 [Mycobacteroides abscessus]|nr:hypothetical protein D2E62_21560 [Mycobacteroides abscessus]
MVNIPVRIGRSASVLTGLDVFDFLFNIVTELAVTHLVAQFGLLHRLARGGVQFLVRLRLLGEFLGELFWRQIAVILRSKYRIGLAFVLLLLVLILGLLFLFLLLLLLLRLLLLLLLDWLLLLVGVGLRLLLDLAWRVVVGGGLLTMLWRPTLLDGGLLGGSLLRLVR